MTDEKQPRPRVGIPYRTVKEQDKRERTKYEHYLQSIRAAHGEPVEISLLLSREELAAKTTSLDAIVLPGSPADVDPALYHAARHPKSADSDAARERTDRALLDHALGEGKPVLAICYGIQILNVHLGGTLIQHISSLQDSSTEVKTTIPHPSSEQPKGTPFLHPVLFEKDSRMAKFSGALEVQVNSSHHQSIREPGRNLRVVGRAPDGVVEAVEWTGDSNWVIGVQWHPERMTEDALAQMLFRDLMAAARGATVRG